MRRDGRRAGRARAAVGRRAAWAALLLLGAGCGRSLYSPPACSDGIDNDGDGLTDLADPQCADPGDDDEGPAGDAGGPDDGEAGADGDADAEPDTDVPVEAEADVEPDADADVGPESDVDADAGPDTEVEPDADVADDGGDDGEVYVPCEDGRPCTTMPVGRCVSGACASVWESTVDGDRFGAAVALDGSRATTAPMLDPGYLLIGAPESSSRWGRATAGEASTRVELGTWDGSRSNELFGHAVAVGPDLGGATGVLLAVGSKADLLLGIPGRVAIYSGAAPSGPPVHELSGPEADSLFGASVAWGPDVDGDTVEDLAVGAPGVLSGGYASGAVTLYAGGAWTALYSWPGSRASQFGAAVARGPAIRPGGEPVTLIGAPLVAGTFTDAGCAYLYEGATDSERWSACGDGLYETFGAAVAAGTDATGDGHGDWAVAGPGWSDGRGRVRLYAAAGELRVWNGAATYDDFGWSIALGPDADGVTGGELLVGAPGVDGDRGRVYLFRHDEDAPLRTWDGESAGDRFGCAVSLGGDVDGDGLADVLVGACGSGLASGKAYLFGSASW